MDMSNMLPFLLMSRASGSNGEGGGLDMMQMLQMMNGGGPIEEDLPVWGPSGISLGSAPDRSGAQSAAYIGIAVMPPTMQRSKASLRVTLQTATSTTTTYCKIEEIPMLAAWLKAAPANTLGVEGKQNSLAEKWAEAQKMDDEYATLRQAQSMGAMFS